MENGFLLKGDICYSLGPTELRVIPGGYAVCVDGEAKGAFAELPGRYSGLPLVDRSGSLVMPGLCDLHMHAPQYAFRGLGMDLERLE